MTTCVVCTRMSPFWILLQLRVVVTTGAIMCAKLQLNWHQQQINTQFLQAACPSCHPTVSVSAQKGKSITFHGLGMLLFLSVLRPLNATLYDPPPEHFCYCMKVSAILLFILSANTWMNDSSINMSFLIHCHWNIKYSWYFIIDILK